MPFQKKKKKKVQKLCEIKKKKKWIPDKTDCFLLQSNETRRILELWSAASATKGLLELFSTLDPTPKERKIAWLLPLVRKREIRKDFHNLPHQQTFLETEMYTRIQRIFSSALQHTYPSGVASKCEAIQGLSTLSAPWLKRLGEMLTPWGKGRRCQLSWSHWKSGRIPLKQRLIW